jgi:hypothetical protein
VSKLDTEQQEIYADIESIRLTLVFYLDQSNYQRRFGKIIPEPISDDIAQQVRSVMNKYSKFITNYRGSTRSFLYTGLVSTFDTFLRFYRMVRIYAKTGSLHSQEKAYRLGGILNTQLVRMKV